MAKIIISGGGTGGHVFPAIAIADAIKRLDPKAEILFVGAKGKIEMEKVPKAGYPIKALWISGFHRQLTLRNLLFPVKLMVSLVKAWQIVRTFKPDVAVGVGGYASGPTLQMANRMGVATVLQEQNSYAGVTNKLLATKAAKICVAYEKMERYFPKEKIEHTGNPVRVEVTQTEGKKAEALQYFGLNPDLKTVFLVGGSLGARTLNNAMEANFNQIANRQDVQFLWQCGKLYFQEFQNGKTAQLPNVKLVQFVDKMDFAYSAADVVISRAGAISISELCLVKKPVILVPSPNVAEDHQTKNAQALVEQSAAVMVEDKNAVEALLFQTFNLLGDVEKQASLSKNIAKLAAADAAERIAKVVLSLVKK